MAAGRIGTNDHQLPERVQNSFAERPSNLGELESIDDDNELAALGSRVVPLDASMPKTARGSFWGALCGGGNCFRRRFGHKELQR
eukprot:COSAG05_NODE_11458_length_512_cov_1.353511_1_plen_84_part_01